MKSGRDSRPLAERFWSKVNKNGPVPRHLPELGGCWVWMGAPRCHGYGGIRVGCRTLKTNRVSWELANGVIPDGQCVLHKCDDMACVNPSHLFLGTQRENIADMDAKGRRVPAAGDRNGSRKHPDRRPRGDTHWGRRHPEKYARGPMHARCNTSRELSAELLRLYKKLGSGKRAAEQLGISVSNAYRSINGEHWTCKP